MGRLLNYRTVLVLSSILYSSFWSYITVLRYLSFNSGVMDLGVNSYLLYSLFHQPFSLYSNGVPQLALNKMIYFLIAPLFNVFPEEPILLVFQSVIIGVTVFPLFGIARHFTGDVKSSLFIALTFIFYYPMGGVNWFDFHFMALVPFLFTTGFYFYLERRDSLSFLFVFLAVISDYLVPLIAIIFSALIFRERKRLSLAVAFSSTAVFLVATAYFGFGYLAYWSNFGSVSHYVSVVTATWQEKLFYLLCITAPLLFIPFLDRKYIFLTVPFLCFAFLNSYYPYISPMFFQYPSLIAPFLFISLSRGINFSGHVDRKKIRTTALTVLVLNVSLAIVLMPWGPLNSDIAQSYDFSGNTAVQNYDLELQGMIHMIPRGSTVLIQDNMPQLCIGYQWMLPDNWHRGIYPEYVIEDPYSYFLTHPSLYTTPENVTMMNIFNYLYSSGHYGIVAEESGIILMERNYSGPVLHYIPFSSIFSAREMILNNASYSGRYIVIKDDHTSPGEWNQAWGGPYVNLAPGYYEATYILRGEGAVANDSVDLVVSHHAGKGVMTVNSTVFYGYMLDGENWTYVTLYFHVPEIYGYVEFRADSPEWTGSLYLQGVSVQQLSM